MFESTIVPAVVERTAEGGALRAPCWEEIVARLAAADDLRRAMAGAGTRPTGNFERFGESMPQPGQHLVNHDDLIHGKGPSGKTLPPRMAR